MRTISVTFMFIALLSATEALAGHNFGLNLGFTAGRLEQEQSKEDYDNTQQATRGLTYSGLKIDLVYARDLSPRLTFGGGFGFVTAFESLSGARSLKNGPFVMTKFYLMGGPKAFSVGEQQLQVEEKSSSRLTIPLYFRYETVDFQNSVQSQSDTNTGQTFNGSTINAEAGIHYERDVSQLWTYGSGLGFRMFGIPMSKSKTTDSYLTLYLSAVRTLQ